jgi:hypothetical protein
MVGFSMPWSTKGTAGQAPPHRPMEPLLCFSGLPTPQTYQAPALNGTAGSPPHHDSCTSSPARPQLHVEPLDPSSTGILTPQDPTPVCHQAPAPFGTSGSTLHWDICPLGPWFLRPHWAPALHGTAGSMLCQAPSPSGPTRPQFYRLAG